MRYLLKYVKIVLLDLKTNYQIISKDGYNIKIKIFNNSINLFLK